MPLALVCQPANELTEARIRDAADQDFRGGQIKDFVNRDQNRAVVRHKVSHRTPNQSDSTNKD